MGFVCCMPYTNPKDSRLIRTDSQRAHVAPYMGSFLFGFHGTPVTQPAGRTMPEPRGHPHAKLLRRVARFTVLCGVIITAIKFGAFAMTNSVAVLSDALESIVNVVAAALMAYTIGLSNRPADAEHPYGHGKAQFMSIGFEGGAIGAAGLIIVIEAIGRLFHPPVEALPRLGAGMIVLVAVASLTALLAAYLNHHAKQYDEPAFRADARHLMTDVISTGGVVVGLLVVQTTGWQWVDPAVALGVAGVILFMGGQLLRESLHGLMDRIDFEDDTIIRGILDEEVNAKAILGYHKVRHRHSGRFHWVDLHIQVDGDISVRESHDLASRIERRIEEALGEGNATAHVEPPEHVTEANLFEDLPEQGQRE